MDFKRIDSTTDLTPVFGPVDEAIATRMAADIDHASRILARLAESLAEMSASTWTAIGLCLDTYPSGQASVTGYVEGDGLTFAIELLPDTFDALDDRTLRGSRIPIATAWDVEASVLVASADTSDSGQSPVMHLDGGRHTRPDAACSALARLADALERLARSRAATPAAWPI